MKQRPLIAAFLFLTGGIITAHCFLIFLRDLILPAVLLFSFLLLLAILSHSRLRLYLLLLAFLAAGILLYLRQYNPSQLLSAAGNYNKISIEGTILEPVKTIDKKTRITLRVDRFYTASECRSINEKIVLTVYRDMPPLNPGTKIRFSARLKPFKNFNNPGRYDYENAMKMAGFSCSASVSDGKSIILLGPGHLGFPGNLIEILQRPVREFLSKTISFEDSSLYRALILGERQGISNEQRELFNKTGLGHILAVSGLHIGLVAWISFFFIKWLLLRSSRLTLGTDIKKTAAVLTCIPVLSYSLLAGFHVSTQRALIMILAFLFSLILGREKDTWSTLALAGLMILIVDPFALFSISFQLSFTAVVGILWLMPAFLNFVYSRFEGLNKEKTLFRQMLLYLIGIFAVTVSATVFLLPLITFYFHRVSCVTVPANILIMPVLGFWVLPFGLISAAFLPVSTVAADVFLQIGTAGLHLMMDIIRYFAGLSWSSFWTIMPNLFEILLFYAVIFFGYFFKRWKWTRGIVFILLIIILSDIAYWTYRVRFNRDLEITFLDVGQGNSALIAFPGGKKMLIDGGGFFSGYFDTGRMVVAPFLFYSKILSVDYVVLSHPHADHMNGLSFIAEAFNPKEFWSNGDRVESLAFHELINKIEIKGIKKILPEDLSEGREIGGAKVEPLYPLASKGPLNHYKKSRDIDNRSLVLKITYQDKSFLFPGDIRYRTEKFLVLNSGDDLRSDILLFPHHGSKSSGSMDFLKAVNPDISVISSGEYNRFGFPHEQVLKRLQDAGSKVVRIDRKGAVRFKLHGNRLTIKTFR